MKKIIIICLLLSPVAALGQGGVPAVLDAVRENNPVLKAARSRAEAQGWGARVGNSLPDPSVTYDYLWGSPAEVGKSGELNVVQAFDFPTLYADRGKRAGALDKMYRSQYDVLERDVLLEATEVCIGIIAMRQKAAIADARLENARMLEKLYDKRSAAGDAGAIELGRLAIEITTAINDSRQTEMELTAFESRLRKLAGGGAVEFAGTAFGPLPSLPDTAAIMSAITECSSMRPAQYGYEAAVHEVRVARGGSLPRFEVGYRREFSLGEHFDGIKMGISVPMFGNRNNVKRANAEKQAALYETSAVEDGLEAGLRELLIRAASLKESLDNYGTLPPTGQQSKLLYTAMAAGHINFLQYCTEMSALYQVEEAIVDATGEYLTVCARIERMVY